MFPQQETVRKRGVGNIIDELITAKHELPFINYILINDDDFFIRSENEIEDFARAYKENVGLPLWITGLHVATFNKAKFSMLVDAGLRLIRVGIQSGSEYTKKMYNRHYSNLQVIAVAKAINKFKNKIASFYDIILDNPWESEHDLIKTLMLLSSLPIPYGLMLYSLSFFPGTTLYDRAKKEGIIEDTIDDIYNRNYYVIKPIYLNKLFMLLEAYSRRGWFIPPALMLLLTNRLLRKLRFSHFLYSMLYIFQMNWLGLFTRGLRNVEKGNFLKIFKHFQKITKEIL